MEQVLLFRLGDHLFGLEVANVQEIVESPRLYYIPRAPAFFRGAMNLHGNIVPVLDLGGYLGIAGEERDARVIVLPSPLCSLGFTATAVRRIVPLDPDLLMPYCQAEDETSCVRFICEREGETIHMLDVARLVAGLENLDFGRI